MRNNLTDHDVLTYALAGCNAAELADYAGTSLETAQARLDHVLHAHRNSDPHPPRQTTDLRRDYRPMTEPPVIGDGSIL